MLLRNISSLPHVFSRSLECADWIKNLINCLQHKQKGQEKIRNGGVATEGKKRSRDIVGEWGSGLRACASSMRWEIVVSLSERYRWHRLTFISTQCHLSDVAWCTLHLLHSSVHRTDALHWFLLPVLQNSHNY